MGRLAQVGIAVGALGLLLLLIGLFPGMTGVEPTPGVGLLQITAMLSGFGLFIFGALVYVKYTFYLDQPATLAQHIGTRLAMTGLLLAALVALADPLGYGSHGSTMDKPNMLGPLQAGGIIASYALSCFGVLVYALAGDSTRTDDKNGDQASTAQEDENE